MSILYFDCEGGASGDMILASLVSLGVPLDYLTGEIKKLAFEDVKVHMHTVQKNGIASLQATVSYKEHHHHHRSLNDIIAIIDRSPFTQSAKEHARAIFTLIAEAEAAVHALPVEQVHFHEVGAVDSIVDILGAVLLIEKIAPEKIIASPLPYGFGEIEMAHGTMPNPAPATAEIMKGIPSYRVNVRGELVTPTAAAIFKHYAAGFQNHVSGSIQNIGYGCGSRIYDNSSNMLRALLLRQETAVQQARVISCNIDDMTPEALAHVQIKLLDAGADDVWLTPVSMKKGRAAQMLSVLSHDAAYTRYIDIILRETTSWGVRVASAEKIVLPREIKTVATAYGPIRVKYANINGMIKSKPEYEDCKRAAEEHAVPLAAVYQAVDSDLNQQR